MITSSFVAKERPMTRACAPKHNYKVNSFLAVGANSSLNVVLKPCYDFIMLRCLGGEPSWSGEDNKAIKAVAPKIIRNCSKCMLKRAYLSTPKVV
jgi:hypothetical protein